MRLGWLIAIVAQLLSAPARGDGAELDEKHQYVVPAARATRFVRCNFAEYKDAPKYTPTREQVDTLNRGLIRWLKAGPGDREPSGHQVFAEVAANVAKYDRQYIGATKDGVRVILVEMYIPMHRGGIAKGCPLVEGGGFAFCRFVYTPSTRTYSNLGCNPLL